MGRVQTKVNELEIIKGIAALSVAFFHVPMYNPILDIKLKSNGYLMVDLFFVLSGPLGIIWESFDYVDRLGFRKNSTLR